MIDPATSWIEIRMVPSYQAELVSNQAELAWLIRYMPSKVIVDRGNEFLAEFKTMIQANHMLQ